MKRLGKKDRRAFASIRATLMTDMGVILAIKRSYRHLLPQPFLSPRKFARRWYAVAFFYTVGLFTGMYIHPADPSRITYAFIAVMVCLAVIKWWSGGSTNP